MTKFLKRREKGASTAKEVASLGVETADPAFAKKWPALAEFLACEEWAPGEARERGTVTFFFEQGSFKASLNDRDAQQSAFVSKSAFTAVLDAIEKGLVTDSLDWRMWRGGAAKKGKRA